jgi:hypothetical protein
MDYMANVIWLLIRNLRTWLPLGLLVCLCGFHVSLAQSPAATYALRGALVTPDGIIENGTILIRQGKIVAVGTHVELPPNETLIDTHGVIAPGLIDLHNHLTWNVFPRWHPIQEFGNRYDWQQKPIYQTLLEFPASGDAIGRPRMRDGALCRNQSNLRRRDLCGRQLGQCLQPGAYT